MTVEERRASYFLERRADFDFLERRADRLRHWRLAGEADSPIWARTSSSSSGEEEKEGEEQEEDEEDSQGGASPMRAGLTESPPGDCSQSPPED